MDLSGILAIAGSSGLFKMVAQARNGIIVESLEDGKRFHASANKRISALEDISIYTEDDDMPLSDVMRKIYDGAKGAKTIEVSEGAEAMRKQFLELIPNYDQERVYNSDIKKVFSWYNLLHEADMLKLAEEETKEEKANGESKEEESKEAKPKAKADAKPKAAKKTNVAPKAGAKKTSTAKGAANKPVKARSGK